MAVISGCDSTPFEVSSSFCQDFSNVCANKENKYQNKDVLEHLLEINFGGISILNGERKQELYG